MKHHYRYSFVCLILSVLFLGTVLASCAPEETPTVKVKNLIWAVSAPLPDPESFFEEIPDGYTVRFAEDYGFPKLQTYPIELILTSPKGQEYTYTATLELIRDDEPPKLIGLRDLSVSLGRGVSYLAGVSATDNCHGEVKIELNTSKVDLGTLGTYPVYYTAIDLAGNRTTVRMSLTVYQEEVTEDMLNERIDAIIADIIRDDMSKEEQARAIYNYVHDRLAYTPTSDKSSWVRAAYEGLTKREGDCYTFFALSKAFFERLGIDNIDIQRTQEMASLMDERHFWNLVNIGTADEPRWYHFDACRIDNHPSPWGCLMTDEQINTFSANMTKNGINNYFYAYDPSGIPTSETTVITHID